MSHASHVPTVAQRFGYRGRVLSLIGAVWILVGIAIGFQPVQDPDHLIVIEYLPMWLRVAIWCGAGTIALITSWWPAGADKYGFMALVIPAALRCGAYTVTTGVGMLTGNEVGNEHLWIPAASWAFIVALVLILSAWPEPGELREDMQ